MNIDKIFANYLIFYLLKYYNNREESEVSSMDIKKDNFRRISENRVSKILATLNQLTNLGNSAYYEYTDEDIYKIFKSIEDETKKAQEILLKKNRGKNPKRFEL